MSERKKGKSSEGRMPNLFNIHLEIDVLNSNLLKGGFRK